MTGFHITMPSMMSFSYDVLFRVAQSASLAPSREMPNLVPDSLSRPVNILLPTSIHGRPAALDLHVMSSLLQQTLGEAAFTLGHALQVGVQRKLASHVSACRSAEVDFIPIVTEVLGGLAEDTISIIRAFGETIGRWVGPQSSTTCTKQLFHRVAVSLWRGNAGLWLHCQPILPLSVDGLV